MVRMAAPFTGAVHDVAPSKVAARIVQGYTLLDEGFRPEPEEEPETQADAAEGRDEGPAEPETHADAPNAESTIAEIRLWAKGRGIELPKKGNKAQLLEAIAGAS